MTYKGTWPPGAPVYRCMHCGRASLRDGICQRLNGDRKGGFWICPGKRMRWNIGLVQGGLEAA